MARGEFRRVDVSIASRLMVAPLFSAALWRQTFATRVEDDLDPDRFFETHLDLFFRGLETRPD